MKGMLDKKSKLDSIYQEFDEELPHRTQLETRFRTTIDQIVDAMGDELGSTAFRRRPLFYTLYCVVYHRLFGLPGQSAPTSKRGKLDQGDQSALRDALLKLTEIFALAKEGENVPTKYAKFATATQRQTDNIAPRAIRFTVLYSEAF
jgi:hypothetical protein